MTFNSTLRSGLSFLAMAFPAVSAEPLLEIHEGDHIAIVGSGLADRQQHQGWFEALIHRAYPDAGLTIRNLGFAADEVNVRPRSKNVPPTEWFLAMKKGETKAADGSGTVYKAGTDFGADVIFAYWGFNESFRGPEGLESFKENLKTYLASLQAARFNGTSAPRVVLFSPIAQEDRGGPDLTNTGRNNGNLALYTSAMAEVAKEKGVGFVDLYQPSLALFEKTDAALSINGIHLTDEGDKLLAPIQFKAVFGKDPADASDPLVAKIREAVVEKNTQWHHRYRTVDQYNIFGDRSLIDYEGVNNNVVLNDELAQRDVKTANRDELVRAVANGRTLEVKDDNLPEVRHTPPNREKVPYNEPQDVIDHLKLPPNCKVELIASEKEFPEFVNPVQMNFDTKGRLWIAVWPNYPETSPTTKVFDKLLVIDLDPKTGKAAKVTTFADGLNCPTGFQFHKDGVLVMQSPDLWYLQDTDGDGKADKRERVLHGLDAADSHHETNSMCLEPGGAVYLSDGVFHRSNVETFDGPVRNTDGAIYRYEPNTGKFMRHAAYGFANPHGRVFDYWGNDLITDATGNDNYFGPAMSGHLDTGAHPPMNTFWNRPSRPCPGTAILTSRHFPDDWQGLFLNTNVISLQGIFRAKLTEEGSGIKGETLEHLVAADVSKAPNFRPSGITVAPDGSLYFMDWSQMLIGHLQHHLRDPNRDHQHGRLYRITYDGRPLMVPKKIDGQPVAALLDLLKEPENDVRLRAKIELGKHRPQDVAAAVLSWISSLDPEDAAYEHHLLEALWVHQWHDVVDLRLLDRVLKSPEPRARAQGVRVLGYWRDRVPDGLARLKTAARDDSPRVRLEAVRVASFFRVTEAADVALAVLAKPMDYYLGYCFGETMRQLKPWWRDALAEGKEIAADNPAGMNYLLGEVATGDLMKLPASKMTLMAALTRPDASPQQRDTALVKLAELNKTSPAETLVAALRYTMIDNDATTRELGNLLLRQDAATLKSIRPVLAKMVTPEYESIAVTAAAAALIVADGTAGPAWNAAVLSPKAMRSFLATLPMVPDLELRAGAGPAVTKLLAEFPPAIDSGIKNQKGVRGRFIRVELPRTGTLSLAEVEVIGEGTNLAPRGKATQHSTAYDGDAARAVDGKTDGFYYHASVTHTAERVDRPWWELDLGSEQPLDSVTVWNRTDGPYGERLDGFDLQVMDSLKTTTFRKTGIPAPKESARIEMKNDAAGDLRRDVIRVLPHLGNESGMFGVLAGLIQKNDQTATAALAMAELPREAWNKDQASTIADGLIRWARDVPAEFRTGEEYKDVVKVAEHLVSQLPAEQAASASHALANLDVKVFTIKAVPEQLRYDTARLVVEAGKPFEVIFENPDAMPHNLVFVKPGAMQEVALSVQAQAPDKLDAKGRAYLPEADPRVIDATKLVEAGKSETLILTAPSDEGTYEYVCTFPGHWAIMKGELVVTKDVKAYLSAHPAN